MPAESTEEFRAEWKPASILERADWSQIFGRVAPVEIDYGCGEGAFLIAQAQKNPGPTFWPPSGCSAASKKSAVPPSVLD